MENETTPTGLVPVDDFTFTCDKCERKFKSAPALRMHQIRKHSSKNWSSGGNFAGKAEKRKAYKKQYDLKKKAEKMQQRRDWHTPKHSNINFCPECGCNLQVYNVAKATAERLNENAST